MKKIISLVLVLLLFPALAMAEINLSRMTYDELVALKDQINLAIWNSQEWQEVEVPQGVWLVGQDIPAGHWTLKTNATWASINIGTKLSTDGKGIDTWNSQFFYGDQVCSPDGMYFNPDSDKTEIDFDLKEGTYVIIEYGNVIFSPYAGKPSLGFK